MMCGDFKFQIHEKFSLAPVEYQVGDSQALQCSEEIVLSVRKVDLERGHAFLKYMYKDEVFYSDALVFEGAKEGRSALYLSKSVDNPVLINVESCTKESCMVSCLDLDLSTFTCK